MTDRRSQIAVAGLHVIALALVALHGYARTLPPTPTPIPAATDAEAAWWGFWPITYAAQTAFALAALVVLALVGWGWWRLARSPAPQDRLRGRAVRVAIVVALGAAFFAFPIVHTRWGDAYMLAKGLAWPDPDLRITHSWQAPLDVYLHSRVWLALHSALAWEDAMPVYRLLSPLAGLLYLGSALALSNDARLAPGWLSFGLLASLGLLQLFFGYVENYSFAAAGILAYLWLGRRVLCRQSPLWSAALVLALTIATHPSTVILAPSLLYLGWCVGQIDRDGTRPWVAVVLAIAVPMVAVAAATLLLMETGEHGLQALFTTDRPGGGDARWFVPLMGTTTRWEHYTLLSWAHLRDLLNGQILVAPVVLPSLVWLGLAGRTFLRATRPASDGPTLRFFAVAALAYLAFTVVWNPDYGGQRDWDLLSLAAIPATLWLIAVAVQTLHSPALVAGMVPLLAFQALHTAAWVFQNTRPWAWP
jgi:hypothetical protein